MSSESSVVSIERFKELSPAQFFARYREVAGFSNPARALYQAVRELVENSLDATETHGILPNIKIVIRQSVDNPRFYTITVEDNGIGIQPQYVPNAFCKVLYSSKYVLRQTRGMYGLGIKAAVLYAQMTAGSHVEVITSPVNSARIYYFKMKIDLGKNEPLIFERGSWRKSREWHGTIVSLTLEGDWPRAKQKIFEYIKRTAVITPYANIVFVSPDEEIVFFKRSVEKLPQPPLEVKPHPCGVDVELLKEILRSSSEPVVKVLTKSFQGVGDSTAEEALKIAGIEFSKPSLKLTDQEIVKLATVLKGVSIDALLRARDSTRATTVIDMLIELEVPANKDVLTKLLNELNIDPLSDPRSLSDEAVEAIYKEIAKLYPKVRPPSPKALSPLGEDIIEAGLKKIFNPDFVKAVSRKPRVYQGHPFIVEAAVAYGGGIPSSSEPTLLRYANKIPLLYDEKADVSWKVIEKINWEQYNIVMPAPLIILTHVCSTKVPFKGVGKESIADVPEVERELGLAIKEALRALRDHLVRRMKEELAKRKALTLIKYVPEVAINLSKIAGGDGVRRLIEDKLVEIIARKTSIDASYLKEIVKKVKIGI